MICPEVSLQSHCLLRSVMQRPQRTSKNLAPLLLSSYIFYNRRVVISGNAGCGSCISMISTIYIESVACLCVSNSPHLIVWESNICAARVCGRWQSRCPCSELGPPQESWAWGAGRESSRAASSSSLWRCGGRAVREIFGLLKCLQRNNFICK